MPGVDIPAPRIDALFPHRIVKIQGEFTGHWHADTDKFFLVLDGQLTI